MHGTVRDFLFIFLFLQLIYSFPALNNLAKSGTRPKVDNIRKWLQLVDSLTKILTRYRDKDSLQQLQNQQKTLGDVLGALGLDEKGRDKTHAWILLSLFLFLIESSK